MVVLGFLFEWEFWYTLIIWSSCIGLLGFIVHICIIYTHLRTFPTSPYAPIFGHILDYIDPYTYLNGPTTSRNIDLHDVYQCFVEAMKVQSTDFQEKDSESLAILTNNLVKYGGVLRQYIGPQKPSLIVADRDFLEFLCNNSKYVCKSKFYDYVKPWLGEGLITSDGEKWLSRRKALTASFTQTSQLICFIEIFEQKSNELISILDTFHNKEVDLHPIMKRFTLDVICETAMGVSLNFLESPNNSSYARSVETLCEIAQNRMTSFLKNFDFFFQFSDDCTRAKKALAVVDNMLEEIIERKVEEKHTKGKTRTKKDMLDLLMEVEINGKSLNRSDLREEINTFAFAGYDTTSSAISLALYEMAKKPEIQKNILEEQKCIFKEDFKTPTITYAKLQEMTYLDMVIKETLRLHTIVPVIGKRVTKNLKYGDKSIPSMLNFSIFIHGFHHTPKYFPEPDTFIPERFAKKMDPFTYIPFGVKPRQCLGKNFAMLEMKCVISKIIRHYEVIQIPEHQLKLLPKLVIFSSSGIWIKLRKRSKNVTIQKE